MPKRIRLSRAKGWRIPPNTVKVARPTRWGNPFSRKTCGFVVAGLDDAAARVIFVRSYRELLVGRKVPCLPAVREWVMTHIGELRGKDLACWCPLDQPCHADVLLTLANGVSPAPIPHDHPDEAQHG